MVELVARWDPTASRFVAGSPALDVWSSGDTADHALGRARDAVALFIEEAEATGTLSEILTHAGLEVEATPREEGPPPGAGVLARPVPFEIALHIGR